jgi:hypothetical protein
MSKAGQFLLYTAPDGAVKVDVFIQQETVWLNPEGAGGIVRRQGSGRQQTPEKYLRFGRID